MRTMLLLVTVLIVPMLTIACAPAPPCESGAGPQIELATVPPLGSSMYDKVYGNVCGVTGDEKIVVYIEVNGGWWGKPTEAQPFTTIGPFGSFSCDVTTGGVDQQADEVCAYLVPANYDPSVRTPPEPGEYLAKSCVQR